ncbi:MAG TPA: hypothetical protein VGL71_13540 [Urbifossiella sp.]
MIPTKSERSLNSSMAGIWNTNAAPPQKEDLMKENTLSLFERPTGENPRDFRSPPGGPPRIGDRVTLCYRTEHAGPPGHWQSEFAKVSIFAQQGEQFRGRVLHDAFKGLLPPEKEFKTGDVLTFTAKHVFDFDQPNTQSH